MGGWGKIQLTGSIKSPALRQENSQKGQAMSLRRLKPRALCLSALPGGTLGRAWSVCICNCPLLFVKEDESSVPGCLPGGQHSCTILLAVAAAAAPVALVRLSYGSTMVRI